MDQYDALIGQIYDCAAAPDAWPDSLEAIRRHVDCAYVSASITDISAMATGGNLSFVLKSSPWDTTWFSDDGKRFQKIPGVETFRDGDIDQAWVQLRQLPEAEFQKSDFHNEWVAPQGLRDAAMISFLKRDRMLGILSAATWRDQPLISDEQVRLLERLSPHIRRAAAIGDIVEKGRLELALYKNVVDSLSVAVFIIGQGRQIIFANAAADAMLSEDALVTGKAGMLAEKVGDGVILAGALDKAVRGDATVGIAGIGVPLRSADGDRAAAYVLPIGQSDARRILGRGAAAVFITRRGEQQPVVVEILRTVFDLTPAEARVASLLVQGETPGAIARALGTSITTTRSQLAQAFAKTRTADQVSLVALVNALVPPVNRS